MLTQAESQVIIMTVLLALFFPMEPTLFRRLASQTSKIPNSIKSASFLISLLLLEFGFIGWASEISQHGVSFLSLFFDVLTRNQTWNNDFVFLIIFFCLFACTLIKFRASWVSLQILSASIIPLPLFVYFFDNREFYIHFVQAYGPEMGWVSNYVLLLFSSGVLISASIFQVVKKLFHLRFDFLRSV